MDDAAAAELYRNLRDRFAEMPGALNLGMSGSALIGDERMMTAVVPKGQPGKGATFVLNIGTGFFRTLGIPIVQGRDIDDRDIVWLDALRVGHDDLADAKRRELRPQPSHHLGTRECQQEIDSRARRRRDIKAAAQHNGAIVDGGHNTCAVIPVDKPDAYLAADARLQNATHVRGARARHPRDACGIDFRAID